MGLPVWRSRIAVTASSTTACPHAQIQEERQGRQQGQHHTAGSRAEREKKHGDGMSECVVTHDGNPDPEGG